MATTNPSVERITKNILMILCDQFAAGAIRLYGGPVVTPNIERIAARGTCFDAAYCSSPSCSPSRMALLTGTHPHANGLVANVFREDYPAVGGPMQEEGLLESDATIERLLRTAGWQTRYFGKWHLAGGTSPTGYDQPYREHHEYAREMQQVFATVARSPLECYMDWYGWKLPVQREPAYAAAVDRAVAQLPQHARLGEFFGKMGLLGLPEEQLFDVRVTARCVEALRNLASPYMLTCSLNMPHDPNVVPARYYEAVPEAWLDAAVSAICEPRYANDLSHIVPHLAGEAFLREFRRIYYAQILLVDALVGELLEALETSGKADDTAIVFVADHGDMAGHRMFWKSTAAFYEEITRVPLIIAAPGGQAGLRHAAPVELVDILPTLLELAGIAPVPGLDGTSLAPVLNGSGIDQHQALCMRLPMLPQNRRKRRWGGETHDFMLRLNDLKFVEHHGPDGTEQLSFDLANDPGETRNLAHEPSQYGRMQEMRGALKKRLAHDGYVLAEPLDSPNPANFVK